MPRWSDALRSQAQGMGGTRRECLAAAAAMLLLGSGRQAIAEVPRERLAVLRRGLNITNWFRFPPSGEPSRLRSYLRDDALREMREAGFTFIRLCIQPRLMLREDGSLHQGRLGALTEAIERLHRVGLAVIVDAHVEHANLEDNPADRKALFDFWRGMALVAARFDPARTFIEIMNEPVFRDHGAWAALQEEVLQLIRRSAPRHTVILTGADWGSIDGLHRLQPVRDSNVIYSVHDYTPGILTFFASWEPGVDAEALQKLPFPVTDVAACRAAVAQSRHVRTREIAEYYCGERWNEETMRQRLAYAAHWGRRHGVPVMLLEFGAEIRMTRASRLAYLKAVREAAEREGMGWALWGYGDIMGFPAQSGPRPAQLDPGVLEALGLRAPGR